jgi:hypothetical protein
MTSDQDHKVRENRARRVARRQGLVLRKNPRRDPRATDFGSYMLLQADAEWMVADFGWDHTGSPDGSDWLADVEAYLTQDRHRREGGR